MTIQITHPNTLRYGQTYRAHASGAKRHHAFKASGDISLCGVLDVHHNDVNAEDFGALTAGGDEFAVICPECDIEVYHLWALVGHSETIRARQAERTLSALRQGREA
jgi:hypothetical protein